MPSPLRMNFPSISRRICLKLGSLAFGSLTLSDLLALRETNCLHWMSSTACAMHEPIVRCGEKTTTVTARTVRVAACPQTRSRNAVLIPLRSLRELRSISTATLPLLPNTYSHNTRITNGGIPARRDRSPRRSLAYSYGASAGAYQ